MFARIINSVHTISEYDIPTHKKCCERYRHCYVPMQFYFHYLVTEKANVKAKNIAHFHILVRVGSQVIHKFYVGAL